MTVDVPPDQRLLHRRRPTAVVVALLLLLGCAAVLARAFAWPAAAATPAPSPSATALDDEVLRRFDAAAQAAAADGVTLTITSGWRTVAEQEQIIAAYVRQYGSPTAAHRWVLPPDKSAHVQGEAIDVGPPSGAAWLGRHGGQFGLCRTYANEAWHFEPVIDPGGTCPAPAHADSSWAW